LTEESLEGLRDWVCPWCENTGVAEPEPDVDRERVRHFHATADTVRSSRRYRARLDRGSPRRTPAVRMPFDLDTDPIELDLAHIGRRSMKRGEPGAIRDVASETGL
jgi:hypothetical protein